jgi:hypothetical protein
LADERVFEHFDGGFDADACELCESGIELAVRALEWWNTATV